VHESFRIGPWLIESNLGTISRNGDRVRMEPKAMEVLTCLARHASQVVSKEELMRAVWADTFVTDDVLTRCVSDLRRAFGDNAKEPRIIETIPRRGYRLIAPVEGLQKAELPTSGPELQSRDTRRLFAVLGVALVVIAVALGIGWIRSRTVPANEHTVLVVLPFENLSGDPARDFFSSGLTEEMTTRLGQMAPDRLGVIARASAAKYQQSGAGLEEIGKRLGATYALLGSVRRQGERVRIAAQLIRVRDQTLLWSQVYDENLRDIVGVQSKVAQAVASAIPLQLEPRAKIQLARQSAPVDPAAYEAYLRGRYIAGQADAPYEHLMATYRKAEEQFLDAVELDAQWAPGWSGVAFTNTQMALTSLGQEKEPRYWQRARDYALKALELDSDSTEAHLALGTLSLQHDQDLEAAGREFKRALELNPNDVRVLHKNAVYLEFHGRHEEAISLMLRAKELAPLDLSVRMGLAVRYDCARQYDNARQELESVLAMNPEAYFARIFVAEYYARADFDRGLSELNKARLLRKPPSDDVYFLNLASYYLAAGRKAEAKALIRKHQIEKVVADPSRDFFDPSGTAEFYLGLGETDKALYWIEQGMAKHPMDTWRNVICDEAFDTIRETKAFRGMIAKYVRPAAGP